MKIAHIPVFVMEVILVKRTNKLLELLFHRLQIDLLSILFVIRIEIIREKDCCIVKSFHRA